MIVKAINKEYIFLIVFLLQCFISLSQSFDSTTVKNEIGIDVANALTFIKKNNQSYLINYWYSPTKKTSYRFGLNLDLGTGKSDGKYPSARIGIQKNRRNFSYNFYYGIDFSFAYYEANAQTSSITRIGSSPIIGVEYCLYKNLSVTTEASLNYYIFIEKNNDTFDPIKEQFYHRLIIGSVGMFVIKYRFN
jgi:hypothetical protein